MRKLIVEPHTCQLEIKPPYAISDRLMKRFREAIIGSDIADVTPYLNFIYGNKTGAIWLRVEIDMRRGFTIDQATKQLEDIFINLKQP
jgi:hypothetical protein